MEARARVVMAMLCTVVVVVVGHEIAMNDVILLSGAYVNVLIAIEDSVSQSDEIIDNLKVGCIDS